MHTLGVIVPFRNRWEHLDEFYKHVPQYLDSKDIEFKIIVVEQDNASAFNRGMLCNIGFKEAVKQKCDYVVFHDVDMLPIDIDYSYSKHPVHLASDILPFKSYFGGITMFPVEDFKKINGFSNHYWGWGFEDDDLRYRCDKKDVDYGIKKKSLYRHEGKTVFFNGVDAYISLDNKINYLRDFNITLNLRLGKFIYSLDKPVDIFPILTIKGYDLKLYFSSFNKFTLQWFDKKGKYYDIHSDIVTNRANKIGIDYSFKSKTITLKINDVNIKVQQLDAPLYNYKQSDKILVGTDTENFFSGAIDALQVINNKREVVQYNSRDVQGYKWENRVDSSIDNKFVKVEHKEYRPKEYLGTYVPFRRESTIKRLNHEDSGFVDGRWKHDMTRWNQLRFNNEVVNDPEHKITEGLSTCKFTLHGREKKNRVIHLKVGI